MAHFLLIIIIIGVWSGHDERLFLQDKQRRPLSRTYAAIRLCDGVARRARRRLVTVAVHAVELLREVHRLLQQRYIIDGCADA